jgi:hypothetical protein
VSAWRTLCKAAALATIVAATRLASNAALHASDPSGDLRANPAASAGTDCSARYAALLDLAELVRRDGKSSEVVVRGLSEQHGAMSECLPVRHVRPAPPSH